MTQRRTSAVPTSVASLSARNRRLRGGARRSRAHAPAPPAAFEPLERRQLLAVDLISLATTGNAGDAVSSAPAVSADGRFVAFVSRATNLVTDLQDDNDAADVFIRDRSTGQTQLVSRATQGRVGNDASGGDLFPPSVSADGRFVVFQSEATNLDTGVNDIPNTPDVFVRDMQTGAITMVSADSNGNSAGGLRPAISADGKAVAFHSSSFILVPEVPRTRNGSQVFVRTLASGAIVLASVNASGTAAGNGASASASLSGDGRLVAFVSEATNLVAADSGGGADVYVRDLQASTTALVSANRQNTAGANAASLAPAISADGRFVAFESAASDLVADHTGERVDVFARNLAAQTTSLVSANPQGGAPASGESRRASISADGRFVAFFSTAPGLIAGVASDVDQYLRDTTQNVTYAVELNPAGTADPVADAAASVTGNGRVAVAALGAALAADKNTVADVYLVDVVPAAVDTSGPIASVPATGQPARTSGSKTFDFNVLYEDATGVRVESIGENDVQVTLADGSTQVAKFVSKTGAGASVTATYRLTAPGDALGPEENGAYTVALLSGAVADTAGNAALPGTAGTFAIQLSGGTAGAGVDLVPTVTLAAPPAVVGGSGTGKVTVKVTNNGAAAVADSVRVTLYVSTDNSLDAGDTNLLTVTKRLKVKAKGFKNVKAGVVFPASLPDNRYFVIAALDEANGVPETDDFNNVASTMNSVVVAAPFVDLTGSFPKGPALNTPRGKPVPLSLIILNAGNVPASGNLALNVVISVNGQIDSADPVLATLTKKVSLKAGASKAIKLKLKIPANLGHGTYRILASFDNRGTINESSVTNNTAATNAFQVS